MSKFLLLAFAGLIMTACVVREGGGYYGRGYGGYEQRSYYDSRGDYDHRGRYERHGDYDYPHYWR